MSFVFRKYIFKICFQGNNMRFIMSLKNGKKNGLAGTGMRNCKMRFASSLVTASQKGKKGLENLKGSIFTVVLW